MRYTELLDSLLEQGVWASEGRKAIKETFGKVSLTLPTHVKRRELTGWRFEVVKGSNGDTFYKVIDKPTKAEVEAVVDASDDETVSGEETEKKMVGVGKYTKKMIGSKHVIVSVFGGESARLDLPDDDVKKLLEKYYGGEVEIRGVRVKGNEEEAIFALYR
jgi:hypothetical protein